MSVATVAAPVAERRVVLDDESRAWLADLRSTGSTQDTAVERLHELLLRAARFEVARRRPMLPNLRGNELDDIALEAADDALMSVLARLDDFCGDAPGRDARFRSSPRAGACSRARRAGRRRRSSGASSSACSKMRSKPRSRRISATCSSRSL